MIDFEIPEDAKAVRSKVRDFVHSECIPAEKGLTAENFDAKLAALRASARAKGLWAPFIPQELGGMGLGPLANALVQMELYESLLGAFATNSQVPDDATAFTIMHNGTEEQREKYLKPFLNGEKRFCFAMTEKAAGSDATGMQTTAVLAGNEWVLNGEKWFTSSAHAADTVLIMAKTDPEAPRHAQYSTFICELPNPGFQIVRTIDTMTPHSELDIKMGKSHEEIKIENLRLPKDSLLGGRGKGFDMGQHRLAYGRLRHGMHNIAMAQRALDLAAKQVTTRETFGERLADRQGVQWMLADCGAELYKARLVLLHIAWKAETGQSIHNENGYAKIFLADMVHKVVDTALQLHGALGYSLDTPLAEWYREIRIHRLADGPHEVHRWRSGRNLIKAYEKYGTTASACGGELV